VGQVRFEPDAEAFEQLRGCTALERGALVRIEEFRDPAEGEEICQATAVGIAEGFYDGRVPAREVVLAGPCEIEEFDQVKDLFLVFGPFWLESHFPVIFSLQMRTLRSSY
jgi:hypothetical protein